MKVLVTGATGFIGSHIVRHLLARRDNVRALIRPGRAGHPAVSDIEGVSWSYGDLTDSISLGSATKDIEVVYHAAALLDAPYSVMRRVNIDGLKNLLEVCVQNRIDRFVHISSISVYAPSQATIVREDHPLGGSDTYGHIKAEGEALVKAYADSFGLAYSIIRPCVVYGECDYHNFTPRLFRLLRRPIIPVIAGQRAHMLVVHVADVAGATILAGTHPNAVGQAYNITGGRLTSLRELAEIYGELTGQRKVFMPVPVLFLRAALLTRWLVRNLRHRQFGQGVFLRNCDVSLGKARIELGYEPGIGLREGLRRTLTWYESSSRRETHS